MNYAMLGTTEYVVIGGVFMLLFGARKLPVLARSLGQSFVELRKGLDPDGDDEEPKKLKERESDTP